ncbi:hypothetical protein CEQ21_04805 [Niallia circulans]|uniref:Uncharacterized protein n=1 Tax=Niallia circulans TaxID=1397 RepID=A0A553STD4_NIACI|nr:hypothetical protein [Niallia circulans]TRZ40259.1 hypothetical protein CEQ21_04805 [Niallia circulans]
MDPKVDYFKEAVKGYCRRQDISPQRKRFSRIDGFVTISIKNEAENGLDTNCFKVLNFMISGIGQTGTKFSQTPILFANADRVDRIDITMKEQEYTAFLNKLLK